MKSQIGLSYPKANTTQLRAQSDFNPNLYITSTLTKSDIILLKQVFDSLDSRGIGCLSPNDLKQILHSERYFATKETVYDIIADFDENCEGGLDFQAFLRVLNSKPQKQSKAELKKIFRKYDKENKGYITSQQIKEVVDTLQQNYSGQEVDIIFGKLDINNRGKIYFEDFCMIMHHPRSLSD